MTGSPVQRVPFLDIKAQNLSIAAELQRAMGEVIAEAQFILGPAVERFEKAFAARITWHQRLQSIGSAPDMGNVFVAVYRRNKFGFGEYFVK